MAIDYPVGGTDGDGNVFIADYNAQYITCYAPADDDWGTTRSSGDGFYGADKSGTLYYDGDACGFGDFGTLIGGLRHTAWAASSDPPLDEKYISASLDISISADDVIHIQTTTGISNEKAYISSALRWYVQGDFDVEVEWSDYVYSSGSGTGGAYLVCCADSKHLSYLRRDSAGGDYIKSDVRINGTDVNYVQTATTATAGKFRYTRTSGVIRRYYDVGGGWVQQGTDQTLGDDAVYFWLCLGTSGSASSMNIKFTNFIINSGTISNKIGWAREAFGSHRGNRDDFPDTAIVVSTDSSVDIIDVDNDLLWMRFVVADNNVLNSVWSTGSWRAYRASMRHGVLLISMASTASEGYLAKIDFNLDCINIHRRDVSGYTGANYKSVHGDGDIGIFYAQGAIRGRNDGRGWEDDHNTWKQQAYSTRHGDLRIDGGYEYRASANAGGIAVFKWRRWYLCGTSVPEAITMINWAWDTSGNLMYWCYFRTSGELMYMDGTNVYSVLKTTYEAAFDGSFSADYTKALPGTRTNAVQYVLVPYSTNRFYTPADEGVYQVDWPSGSFVHQYGSSGSGAVHEILPTDVTVQDLIVADDGGTSVLILVLYYTVADVNQLMAINLSTDVVHAYSLQTSSNEQYAESVA